MSNELVNADFSRRVVIATDEMPWIPSPQAGVERRLLDRIGGEVARLPLYYAPDTGERMMLERLKAGAQDGEVDCPDGEEVFILSGDLEDEHGVYHAGTWIRNPAGFRRSLKSNGGATYWAKRGHLRPIS
jgi:anti-sigma factor ChrR (cupin superfamily)